MKTRIRLIHTLLPLLILSILSAQLPNACAQGTAFMYQGRLNSGGGPANGSYDLAFTLFATSSSGTTVAGPVTNSAVAVTNGLFATLVDFGPGVFSGGSNWLAIAVSTNGANSFTMLAPRQQVTPVPSAIFANTASNLSGTLPAAQLKGSIPSANLAGTYSGVVTFNNAANSFAGDGAGLTSLNAAQLSGSVPGATLTAVPAANLTGTISPARLPGQVLTNNQTGSVNLAGAVTVTNGFTVNTGIGTVQFVADTFVPGIIAGNSGGNSGHLRFRNALEIWPDLGGFNSGYLDVRDTGGNQTITMNGASGNISANSFSGDGSALTSVNAVTSVNALALGDDELSSGDGQNGLSLNTNLFLNDEPIYLRSDGNHGLGYNGGGVTNFPTLAVQPDGPVLWGYTGGALGYMSGGPNAALTWNNSSVNVSNALNVTGNLSANNTPGVNWSQAFVGDHAVNIPNNGNQISVDSCGNAKNATGYFVIMASVYVIPNGNNVIVWLYDTTSGNVQLTYAATSQEGTLTLSWVVPITSTGGYENFAVLAASSGSGSQFGNHNLTVMYFPRQNN